MSQVGGQQTAGIVLKGCGYTFILANACGFCIPYQFQPGVCVFRVLWLSMSPFYHRPFPMRTRGVGAFEPWVDDIPVRTFERHGHWARLRSKEKGLRDVVKRASYACCLQPGGTTWYNPLS